ncbi:hypothetical protein [Modestobacter versicolor]|uniref:hypothetical protein n=1 Tax=Modestobacter versicolor TaxID=429133 RepID=UPI0034DEA3D8
MGRRAGTAAVVVLGAVLVTASGCGFLTDLADPADPPPPPAADAGPPAVTSPPAAAPAFEPGVVAQGALFAGDRSVGTLRVATGGVQTGLVLPFPEFDEDCPIAGPSMQYVAVGFTFTLQAEGGLAGHLTMTPGPATPADAGDVGVFFEPSPGNDEYCTDGPSLPDTDSFWARGTHRVTGYVVLADAVGPATPQGRTEVFATLQAQVSELRLRDDDGAETPLTLGPLSVGAACPEDPGAFCVPLG